MSRSDSYELLIFDWDGTLLDSIATIVACTQATLEELGQPRAEEAVIRGAIGLGLRETVNRFAPGCDDALYGRIVEVYRRLWFEEFVHHPRLFPGSREVLEQLRQQGYLLAVATAKSRRGLNLDLEGSGLAPMFDATRTVDEARSKPNPQMILDILQELGVAARRALMIGDTSHDMFMAQNAGTGAAAVLTGSHDRAELSAASPQVFLEDLTELPSWLADSAEKE
jgi:phosphoglycolate phosphatase